MSPTRNTPTTAGAPSPHTSTSLLQPNVLLPLTSPSSLLGLLPRAQALEADAVVVRQGAADAGGVDLERGGDAADDDHPEGGHVGGVAAELAEDGLLDHGAAGVPDVAGEDKDDVVEDGVRERRLDLGLDRLAVGLVHALLGEHEHELLPARDDGGDRGQQAERQQVVGGARQVGGRQRGGQGRGQLGQRRGVDVEAEGERQEGEGEVHRGRVDGLAGEGRLGEEEGKKIRSREVQWNDRDVVDGGDPLPRSVTQPAVSLLCSWPPFGGAATKISKIADWLPLQLVWAGGTNPGPEGISYRLCTRNRYRSMLATAAATSVTLGPRGWRFDKQPIYSCETARTGTAF
nr:hypothetical protein CFP56_03800 [Quercus suber]